MNSNISNKLLKTMTDAPQTISLYVTYVDKEGPFLKIWGQVEKHQSLYIEQILMGASQQFDIGMGKVAPEVLQPGTLVCAKYKDNKYYRARILNSDFIDEGFVEVNFLEYGNKDVVPCGNIRSLQNFPTSFISAPPLAIGFIFAEAHCPGGGEWNETLFENISKEIKYREVLCHLLAQATNYHLVKIFIDGRDICNSLIQRGLMQPISLQAQQAVMLSMSMQRQQQSTTSAPPQTNLPNSGLNTYKACTLDSGCQYPVYVSYVNDGPCHFSVQLKQTEEILVKLMKDINTIPLRMLEDIPIPGTICLSRCQEDTSICRAVVTNEVDNQFKVFYVDFGNHEVVPLDSLFQIPFKYVLPKVMAIRLSLAGVEKSTVTLEMQCAFKKFVDNRLLHMKILPTPTRMAVPKCELWDPETKTSALDVINRAARHAYPEPMSLTRGFSQPVKVSFVYSCNRFYVQLASKENELASLMAELQEICQTNDVMDPSSIKVDVPCSALFEVDGQWYRGQIVEVMGDNVKVRYIDYGNEETVPSSQLKEIDGEQLTVLRPQAIECCLNGYQNMESDAERDALLEEIILEGDFTMKVIEMLEKKALVDLFDTSNYNVASLLLDKLAAAKSQVSPMLAVQAGNKLEHRKSFQQNGPRSGGDFRREGQGFRGDRQDRGDWQDRGEKQDRGDWQDRGEKQDRGSWQDRGEKQDRGSWQDRGEKQDRGSWQDRGDRQDYKSGRERRDWNNKSNDRPEKSWRQDRQDGKDFRNNERNTNDDRGSWRQNNKGFSPNNRDKDQNSWNTNANSNEDNWDNPSADAPVAQNIQSNNQDSWKTGGGGDTWNDANKNPVQDEWNTGGNSDQGFKKGNFQDRNRGEGRFNNRGGDRFSGKPRDGGFRKRDNADHDSSGSENSFKHKSGPRTSSRNDYDRPKFQKNYDKPRNTSFNTNTDDSWNVSALVTPIDSAPATAVFTPYEVVGTAAKVVISWFHNPSHFFVQLVDYQSQFKSMMEEIQLFYKSRNPESAVVGAPVVGLFPEDNVLYRAQVLEVVGSQYKVYYVDFGNVSTITKVWPVDKKFMVLPAQAIVCGLLGIQSVGDNWPDTDSYSQYFDKENFECQFINKDDVKTYVNFFHDQVSIAQQLVEANLAVYSQPTIPSIEIPLLLGQQFRAVVKSINNLSDIIIALECGMAVSCTMHNLETATETFEDVLKGLLEQTVIIYVDNVLDDKLEITMYDNEGSKLEILNPDDGAYDNLEPLCPLLVLTSTITGYVSHAEENSIFVQPSDISETLAWLLEQMFEHYENLTQETAIIPDEEQIYAIHSEDGNWYRGKITNFDDDKATAHYIDYGNSEDVKFDALRELDPKFKETCILSLQIYIAMDSSPFAEKEVSASIYYGENGWEGSIQLLESTVTESAALASTDDTGFATSSTGKIESEGDICIPTEQEDNKATEESTLISTEEKLEVPQPTSDGKIAVFINHIDTPNEFYIQLLSSLPNIEDLQETLQADVESMPVLENPAAGILCAAPYSADQNWYRAEILDADDDITTVRFVDFGNTDVIDNKTTQIKTLPPHLLSLAVYATKCSLNVKPIESEWSQLALEVFEALVTSENTMVAEFLDQDEKRNYIELYFGNQKVSDVLIKENLAAPTTSSESKLTGFVSHLNSPSEFWIQLENCIDELEWIAEQLSAADTFPELEDLTPGTLCAALFPTDQMWYRARILSNTVAGIELLYIDYGNSCTSTSLRQLPEDLVITAPLALKCSLQKPEGMPNWSPEACQKFSEISAGGQTIFTVKKLTTGETTVVQLILDDEDIITNLLPSTEDGYVKDVNSLENFKIEIGGETIPEPVELEKIPGTEWGEDAVAKFQEISNQGITLLQIERLSENKVRLYVDGCDIRSKLVKEKVSSANVSYAAEDDTVELLNTGTSSELVNSDSSDIVIDHTNKDESFNESTATLMNSIETPECLNISENVVSEELTSSDMKSDEINVSQSVDNTSTQKAAESPDSPQKEDDNIQITDVSPMSPQKTDVSTNSPRKLDEVSSISPQYVEGDNNIQKNDVLPNSPQKEEDHDIQITDVAPSSNQNVVDVSIEATDVSPISPQKTDVLISSPQKLKNDDEVLPSSPKKEGNDDIQITNVAPSPNQNEEDVSIEAADVSPMSPQETDVLKSPQKLENDNDEVSSNSPQTEENGDLQIPDVAPMSPQKTDVLKVLKSPQKLENDNDEVSPKSPQTEENDDIQITDVAPSSNQNEEDVSIEATDVSPMSPQKTDVLKSLQKLENDNDEISPSPPQREENDDKRITDVAPSSNQNEEDVSVEATDVSPQNVECDNDTIQKTDELPNSHKKMENVVSPLKVWNDYIIENLSETKTENKLTESLMNQDDTSTDKKSGKSEVINVPERTEVEPELTKIEKTSLPSSNENSRPSSRNSRRFRKHDDKILPGYFSRPETPVEPLVKESTSMESLEVQSILENVLDHVMDKSSEKESSRPHSRLSHDDKILPAVVSRTHSPTAEKDVKSRPQSACSEKICHDDKVVPAAVSRTEFSIDRDRIE